MLFRGVAGAALLSAAAGCATPTAWQPPPTSFQLAAIEDRGAPTGTAALPPQAADNAPETTGDNARRPDGTTLTPPKVPGKSGGGGSSSPPAPVPLEQVVDRQGQPVAGATVLFADGTSHQADAEGRLTDVLAPVGLPCTVFAPGYASSTLAGGALPTVLHLERLPSADAPFEGDEYYLRGSVTWLESPPLGGTVQYQDDLGSLSNPAVVDNEGFFTLRVVTTRAGKPTGRILALAAGSDAHPMLGLSPAFSLKDQGAALVSVTVVKASQTVNFQVGAPPAELTEVHHQLEFAVEGVAPFVMQGVGTTTGTYKVPAAGALGATVRLVATAADDAGTRRSVVTLDPYALPAAPPAFLPVPTLTVAAATRKVSWTAAGGARAVRLALSQAPNLTEPYWEGWFEGRTEQTFDVGDWPAGASAIARLTAFEGTEATARRVASTRQLRLLPPGDWRGGFRWAEVQTTFTP